MSGDNRFFNEEMGSLHDDMHNDVSPVTHFNRKAVKVLGWGILFFAVVCLVGSLLSNGGSYLDPWFNWACAAMWIAAFILLVFAYFIGT